MHVLQSEDNASLQKYRNYEQTYNAERNRLNSMRYNMGALDKQDYDEYLAKIEKPIMRYPFRTLLMVIERLYDVYFINTLTLE